MTIQSTLSPVLSDHIQQDIFLACQIAVCLLLHESIALLSSAISNHMPVAISICHLNGWSLRTGLTVFV